MGNAAGVRRDFDALERRRFEPNRLGEKGWDQAEVARRLKVARQTVGRWVLDYRTGGKNGLRKAGRKPLLPGEGRQRLTELLLRGPESLG